MIKKELDIINEGDLLFLIENSVLENKTLEYKQELNLNSRDEKKEFLADISSFANASGGDIIYGITENRDDGTPQELVGLDIDNIDDLKGKIEGLIRDGTEPRVYVNIHHLKLSNLKIALIIRITKSWRSPHRVIFGKSYKFFSRNSNGKYHLDVEELRNAFSLSDTLNERIRNFREDRISKEMSSELSVHFHEGPKILLHLIPINAFNPAQNYQIDTIAQDHGKLKTISGPGNIEKYNIDGFLVNYEAQGKSASYTQLFRNGIIEAIDWFNLGYNNDEHYIVGKLIEERLLDSISQYLDILKNINVETPIFIFITLVGVKGYNMFISSGRGADYSQISHRTGLAGDKYTVDRDILLLSESILEDYDDKPEDIMKSCFDSLWNACGYSRSLSYNENGNWDPKG